MLSSLIFILATFGLACVAIVSFHWSGYIRPFIQFKPMFLPCQINSHPLGQCCVRVLRRRGVSECRSTNKWNLHGFSTTGCTPFSSKGPFSFSCSHRASWFVAAADDTTHQASWPLLLTTHTKLNYWLFKPEYTVNMGKVKQLCICFISSRMLLKSIGHVKFVLI